MQSITTLAELERVVGTRPQAIMMKSIPELDKHCVSIVAQSPLALLGYVERSGAVRATTVGGGRGFVDVVSPGRMLVPVPEGVRPLLGSGVSSCFLLPGIGEPLRINGRCAAVDEATSTVTVDVEEAFVHCGKCVHRAKLWEEPTDAGPTEPSGAALMPGSGPLADPDVAAFLASAPFAVIATWDGGGAADASPKGDPGGFFQVLDGHTIAIPDRKGNRRTDTFHNVIEHPSVAAVALLPGDERVLELSGTAIVTDESSLLRDMAVQGSTPKAALVVTVETALLEPSAAVANAGVWDAANHVDAKTIPNLMKVAAEHVASNRTGGLLAGLTRVVSKAASVAVADRVIEAGQRFEYERGLYR